MNLFSVTSESAENMLYSLHKEKDQCNSLISKCYKRITSPDQFEGIKLTNGEQFFFKCLFCGRSFIVTLCSEYAFVDGVGGKK